MGKPLPAPQALPARARLVILLAIAAPLACRAAPSEPPQAAPRSTDAGAIPPSSASPHATHRIVAQDHRHIIPMSRGDSFVLPDDPAFEWRVDLEDRSAFEPATDVDAGGEAYRVTKAGPYRIMVHGDPKCMKLDGGCGTSKRRWDVTFDVR